jgi:nitrous oxidase accessory protein
MSKSVVLLLVLVFLTASGIITFLPVQAESRTIVVPDDYSTIKDAVNAAREGETIFVKKGTYEEKTLDIDKSISITAEDAEFTKLNLFPPFYSESDEIINFTFSWYGSAIIVNANDFKLSGFTINTPEITDIPGGTISITGNRTQIIGNNITTSLSVNGSYCNIAGNTFLMEASLYGSHDNVSENDIIGSGGIYVFGVYNNVFSNNINGEDNMGIHIEGASCIIYDNYITGNSGIGGIYISSDETIVAKNLVDHSSIGIKGGGSDNIICANKVTNNGVGLLADTRIYNYWKAEATDSEGSNNYYANYIANNDVGTDINQYSENNVTSIFYHNNFIDNTYQVETADWDDVYGNDSFDNGEEGNYWSDYKGTDADGDGIGDTPYTIDNKRKDHFPLMNAFDIDSLELDLSDCMSSPLIELISPINATYLSTDLILEFTVNKQTSWLSYILDGEANVKITGNITLPKLSYGSHQIQVYATDLVGHNSTSETIYFSVAEPFPTMLVVTSVIIVAAIVGFCLLVYFKKHKMKRG